MINGKLICADWAVHAADVPLLTGSEVNIFDPITLPSFLILFHTLVDASTVIHIPSAICKLIPSIGSLGPASCLCLQVYQFHILSPTFNMLLLVVSFLQGFEKCPSFFRSPLNLFEISLGNDTF